MHIQHRHLVRLLPILFVAILLASCGGSAQQAFSTINSGLNPGGAPIAPQPMEARRPVAAPTSVPAAPMTSAEAQQDVAVEPSTPSGPPRPVAVNPITRASDDHLSTFAIDVDTAAYTAARNYLNNGQLPPPDAVRVEEFVNYFRYDYPAPQSGAFGIYIESAPSPFGQPGAQVVRVGIQGQRIDSGQRADGVLTFVIDISGSMAQPNRLPLVKQSLRLLVDELRESDQVAIVVYGDQAVTVLDHTSAANRDQILRAIDALENQGSTNAEAGLQMAYELAARHFKPGASNRIILCSDGVANVGATGPDEIRKTIRDYTAQGIYLTTVGFGMGDYNDYLMEQLADDGNGNYAYVDTQEAARRIFVENLTGTLQVIAKDAKIQVDFNPAVVDSYRLLGYENRDVADVDFRNDRVDAGEVGAGHSVTALYEVVPTGQGRGTALTVRVRYAAPLGGEVREIEQAFNTDEFGTQFAAAAPRLQLAVAVADFAEQLRGSAYAQNHSLADVLEIARRIAPQLANDADVQEFVALVERAKSLRG
ncbi:MAG TPA: VWA domain-containing protein [Roseiflexaceae bacterium]|nr:VWA domain-containing protein [Roseiflexaceae bacterium]